MKPYGWRRRADDHGLRRGKCRERVTCASVLERRFAKREVAVGLESHWLDENGYPVDDCDGCHWCAPELFAPCDNCGEPPGWCTADGYLLRTRSVGDDAKRFRPRLGDVMKAA